jgi:hypothetical protein
MPLPSLPNNFMPAVTGYGMSDPGGVMETPVAGGNPRNATEYERGPQLFPISLFLEPDAFAVWTAFYTHVIKNGRLAFTMPLDSGFGVSPHVVKIVAGSYAPTRSASNLWVASFTVRSESEAYAMTAEQAQGMLDLYNVYGNEASALLARIAQFATTDLDRLVGI